MATEALVKRVKEIITLGKSGKTEEAFTAYAELYASPEFLTYPVSERRSAVRLVVNAKVPPNRPPPATVAAYQSAMPSLRKMIEEEGHAADYELLGICHVFCGEDEKAAELFREALKMERARDSGSDLCGSLMKWVAAV